jgi:trk/ktr system potassium uptake protein
VTSSGVPLADRVSALQKLSLLVGMSEEDLARVAERVSEKHFAAAEVLVHEGSVGSDVFFILSGKCEVRRTAGGRAKVVAKLSPGDFFGEMAVLSPDPRTATVVAVDPVRVLTLSAWEFRQAMQANPAMGYQVAKLLAGRLRKAEEELAEARAPRGFRKKF